MDEMSFRLVMRNIKDNFNPETDVLEVSDRGDSKIYVEGTHYSSIYVDGHNLYLVSLDKWNRISYTCPIVHSVDEFINAVEDTALPITMNDGRQYFIFSSRHWAHKLAVSDKYIANYSPNAFLNPYEYEKHCIIFDKDLKQTTIEVTTYEGEKHHVEYLFATPNHQQWIAIINGKPHIIDESGKECPYINKSKYNDDVTINKVWLPADTKGDNYNTHHLIFLYEQDGKFYKLYNASFDNYCVQDLPYNRVVDKVPADTYGHELFRVIDTNGIERYSSKIRHIGNSPIPFVLIDQKYYAVNESGQITSFEVKDKEGVSYLATCVIEIEHCLMFVCIDDKYFPINKQLVLLFEKRYSFDIDVSVSSDVFLVLDNETGKYGFMDGMIELMSPGCVLETDEYNQPPKLQSKAFCHTNNNYPAIFRIDGKVGLNYCYYNSDCEMEIKSIVPMGKYASIREFDDMIRPFCTDEPNYFIVQAWEKGPNGEKRPNESGYGILEVTYFPFTKDPWDISYGDNKRFSVKASLVVPMVMSSRQILDIRDIWELDNNNRLPIFEVLSKGNIKPIPTKFLSNEFANGRYVLAQHLWIAMQNSEKVWWNDVNSKESAIEFLGKQFFSEKYLLSEPFVVYRASEIVFGTEMYEEMLPLLDKAFNTEREWPHGHDVKYPKNGVADFSEVIRFIIDKIVGGQTEPCCIDASKTKGNRLSLTIR